MKKFYSLHYLLLATVIATMCCRGDKSQDLTFHQKCVACVVESNRTFQINMRNHNTKCGSLLGTNPDIVEVTHPSTCDIFKSSCPSSYTTDVGGSSSEQKENDSSTSSVTPSCNCHCTFPDAQLLCPTPTPSASAPPIVFAGKVVVALSPYDQCVLCTENKRHYRINLQRHEGECWSYIDNAFYALIISDKNKCSVFLQSQSSRSPFEYMEESNSTEDGMRTGSDDELIGVPRLV